MRVWRDADGAVLSLAESSEPVKDFDKVREKRVRRWCREIAEDRHAGLIEAHKLEAGASSFTNVSVPAWALHSAGAGAVNERQHVYRLVRNGPRRVGDVRLRHGRKA